MRLPRASLLLQCLRHVRNARPPERGYPRKQWGGRTSPDLRIAFHIQMKLEDGKSHSCDSDMTLNWKVNSEFGLMKWAENPPISVWKIGLFIFQFNSFFFFSISCSASKSNIMLFVNPAWTAFLYPYFSLFFWICRPAHWKGVTRKGHCFWEFLRAFLSAKWSW